MKALLFLACIGVAVSGVAIWTGAPSSHAAAADKIANDGVDLPKGDPLEDAIQKRFGKPDRVTGSGRVLRYDLQNGDTLIVSGGGRGFLHYDLQNGDTLTLIVRGGDVIGVMHERKKKDLPKGDLGDAIQKRFGKPNRVTGSGRAFLHYDLQNGDTLTLIVSGGDVIGVMHERKKK
jgi:hypothetical protein